MTTLADLVQRYPSMLVGELKVSMAAIEAVEQALGVTLPADLKWLLNTCGYASATAVPNLDWVRLDTLRFRSAADLAHQFVVLEDMHDSGVVLLDTASSDGAVVWADWRMAGRLGREKVAATDAEWFPSLAAYTEDRIQTFLDEE